MIRYRRRPSRNGRVEPRYRRRPHAIPGCRDLDTHLDTDLVGYAERYTPQHHCEVA